MADSRVSRLTDGRTAPVLRIEHDGTVTLDGEQFPLIIADEEIETRVSARSGAVVVRLSFLTFGPVIIDQRAHNERSTAITVEPASGAGHTLEDGGSYGGEYTG